MDEIIAQIMVWFTKDNFVYYTALLALITAAIAFYRNVLVAWFTNYVLPFFGWVKTVADINERLINIETEIKQHNSGAIRDTLTSLANVTVNIQGMMDNLSKQTRRLEARQWAIMINTSVEPIFETDPDGLCIKVNRAYLDLLGRPFDDLMGNGWITGVHHQDRSHVVEEWSSAIKDQRVFDLSFRIVCIENITYNVRCLAQPLFIELANGGNLKRELTGYIGRFMKVEEIKL